MSAEQLARIDKPYIIIADYITDIIKDQSDAFVIQARTSVSTMFELMRGQEKNLRNKIIEQLMLKRMSNTRKVIKEVTIWKIEELLDYIMQLSVQRDEGSLTVTELRRVVITIFMVYSVLRLSEIQRAMQDITQVQQGMIILCTNLLKGKRGKVEVSLKRVVNRAVRSIIWFEAWNEKRKIKTADRDLLQRISENKRALTLEECSKEVHIVISNAGIDKKHSVTTKRKVAISAMQNKNKIKIQIDRWSRHSESADIVRENYDVSNNDSIRKALFEWVSTRGERNVNEEVSSPYTRWVTLSVMKCRVMEHHLQQGELTFPTLRNCVALSWKKNDCTEASEEMEEQ
ncbi:MAG: hypothetical protein EZS28_023460 [Streblomastix strix]|uniref:Tyr recombinase domain-containing protein n=1 Tax=Streblomastix strix TaxID=222440 RepID=A0A5J4VF33_9EUKA|nr:MAG: hypothetical protein EZS28_023460 [Streblomastix strix]